MSGQVGIIAYGGYLPKLRLRRSAIAAAATWANQGAGGMATGTRTVASWDEDAITLAVAAARDALGSRSRDDVAALFFASTSAPFADRLNGAVISGALRLPSATLALDVGGSQRAGVSALIAGAAVARNAGGPVLVTAAENRTARPGSLLELANGDAGAAVLLGTGADVVATILATHSVVEDFVGHWRSTAERYDYQWEERWVREEGYAKIVPAAVQAALAAAGLQASEITRFIMPSPLRGVDRTIARAAGLAETALEDSLAADVGFSGSAHALLMLAAALEIAAPGERLLIAGFGSGCDAVVLETTDAIRRYQPARGVGYWRNHGTVSDAYLRYLSFKGEIGMDWGPRAEFGNKIALTAEYRASRDMLGFIGGADRETGVVQFPKTPVSVGPGAGMRALYHDVCLADAPARVYSMTADWLTYHPDPPFNFGLVQFDSGARVMMEFVDLGDAEIGIGSAMDMVFRIKEIDRNRAYRHYFWKARPTDASPRFREAAA